MEIIVYYPNTEEGQAELSKRIASVHAEHAIRMVDRLTCPTKQKLELVDAVVKRIRQNEKGKNQSSKFE